MSSYSPQYRLFARTLGQAKFPASIPHANILLRYAALILALALAFAAHLELGSGLAISRRWALLTGAEPTDFEDMRFLVAALPRTVMAIMVGGALALVGSALQQATQNRLVSPLTLGASSGAWLAIVAGTIFAPQLIAAYGEWISMAGAVTATALVVVIAGRAGVGGLPIILAGMAVTILCESLANGLVLLNEENARNLFIWSAGDLAQTDWTWIAWMAPRLSVIALLLILAPRPLMLLRLGEAGATARGLHVWPVLLVLAITCLWITAVSVSAVGIIGFVGLLAPNIAVWLGARNSFDELLSSLLVGAVVLLLTDSLALLASQWTANLVPSGASAALVGAPALIMLARGRPKAQDHASFDLRPRRTRLRIGLVGLGALAVLAAALALLVAPSANGWTFAWPGDFVLSLRWPRVLTAASAGAGVALAGLLLQRLIRNPLASPDIMGMSHGATLALVGGSVIFGGAVTDGGGGVAILGSAGVLVLLLVLGRRHRYSAGIMALIGISIAALMNALLQFVLASGSEHAFAVLNWMSGSTYRATPWDAIVLTLSVIALVLLSLMLHRWLTLVAAGDDVASARGLEVRRVRMMLLSVAALSVAAVTALMGPLAFVGLMAPHLASMLGARDVKTQILAAPLLAAVLMLLSDWVARVAIYPAQLPAGLLASTLGGAYFVFLLARSRSPARR